MPRIIIPWEQIDPATLYNLIESFVLREGTDYGEREQSLQQQVADVLRQVQSGETVLVWSELHEVAPNVITITFGHPHVI